MFVALERQRLRKQQKKKQDQSLSFSFDASQILNQESVDAATELDKLTDNRKVVVEDLIYIDDMETLIYTTIMPKTSTIFVTHTKKIEKPSQPASNVEVVTL